MENKKIEDMRSIGIQQYKTDVGFRTLVESVNENLYIIPKYQRKYRWNKEQVVKLVESLILGLPIPPIYTCRNENNQLEVLDGQQRLMSLFFYYIGFFLNKKKNNSIDFSTINIENSTFKDALFSQFELEKLDINLRALNGKLIKADYNDLPVELKRKIDYTTITVIEIKIDDERYKTKVLRQIFTNLNRGGTLLEPQEQRNGIYACEFYDMIRELNRNNQMWRTIWGQESAKEGDMEALLRLCALRRFVTVKKEFDSCNFVIEGYKSSYSELLDRFSEEAMKFDKATIEEYKNSLLRFMELFQVTSKQSSKVALFESFYIVYEKMNMKQTITNEIYNKIVNDASYISCARQGTVQMKKMNERWKVVYEIWSGCNK